MARSIRSLIEDALDAAVAQGKLAIDERSSLSQFAGYKGEEDGVEPQRYYLNAQLTEYIEIALSDVITEVNLSGESSPLVLVITKSDAQMTHHLDVNGRHQHTHFSGSLQADFLSGDIATRHLGRSRIAGNYYLGVNDALARHTSFPPCETGGSDCH